MAMNSEHEQHERQPGMVRERLYELSPRRIANVPATERPREIANRVGLENADDRVLLAIVLRSGIAGFSVVDAADMLMQEYGSLTSLARTSVDDLATRRGLGPVRAQVLKAALELGRRMTKEPLANFDVIRTPEDAARQVRADAADKSEEIFWVMLLDRKYRLRRSPLQVSRGILDANLVHPREVFKEAIRSCSAAIVLVHNHPSGDPTPSTEDLRISRQLVEAGRIVEIEVLDHVVIGRSAKAGEKDYISLRESGLVNFSVKP
jgi:DNA repair protein RadC